MSKLSNCLTMIEYLNNGRKYSINELASLLEVTPRMVRVYKEEIEKSGIYIDTVMGPYGGYVLKNTINIPNRNFNRSDYELLDKYINIDDDNKDRLVLLRDKIKGLSVENNKSYTIDSKYNMFCKAIKLKRKIKIKYYSYDTGESIRVIDPIEMYLYNSKWFCTAFCNMKNDMRNFELSRVLEYELLEEKI